MSLKKSSKKGRTNDDDIPLLPADDLQNIFNNLAALYEKHAAFLAKLEEREKAWKENEKEDCIGDVFYIGVCLPQILFLYFHFIFVLFFFFFFLFLLFLAFASLLSSLFSFLSFLSFLSLISFSLSQLLFFIL